MSGVGGVAGWEVSGTGVSIPLAGYVLGTRFEVVPLKPCMLFSAASEHEASVANKNERFHILASNKSKQSWTG